MTATLSASASDPAAPTPVPTATAPLRPRWELPSLALLLILSFAAPLAACSGSHGPHAWATTVCKTLAPWRTEIGSLTTRTQQQMTTRTTPGQARSLSLRSGGAGAARELGLEFNTAWPGTRDRSVRGCGDGAAADRGGPAARV